MSVAIRYRPFLAAILGGLALLPHAPADAARFTDHLDDLETEVTERNAALTGTLDKAQKKAKAAYGKALKALAADTESLAEEIKVAGVAAKSLEKGVPGDETLDGLLEDVAENLAAEAGEVLADLDSEMEDDEASKGLTKALRAIDAAGNFLDASEGESLTSMRLKLMGKAVKKAAPAQRYVAGGGGGGGGGGGEGCYYGSRVLAVGESCTGSWTDSGFEASSVVTRVNVFSEEVRNYAASFYQCSPTLNRMISIAWFNTPPVGTPIFYDKIGDTTIYLGSGAPDGLLGTFGGYGTITFTEVDPVTGTYAGTFTLTATGDINFTDGAFRITGLK